MKDFLNVHSKGNTVSFHMPGHKGAGIYRRFGYDDFLNGFMDWDITEIEGADNLFQAEGIIKNVQERYAELYGVKNSWLLINGTSGGLIASILSVTPRNGKIIMARNCHKAVFNGARLAGAKVAYVYPEIIEENTREKSAGYGLVGKITSEEIKRCIEKNPDAVAVVVTSPNYYGICSDIKELAKVVHGAGMILIVDQAHGAHLNFFSDMGFDMPKPAEMEGADLVVCSTHKTLASMTQTGILNLCSNRVNTMDIENSLQMIESSSPSYVLMSSLDINCDILEHHGKELIKEWKENLDMFYDKAKDIPNLKLLKHPYLDRTKINIDFDIDAKILDEYLISKGIFAELYTGSNLMLMTGIGNVRSDYERLLDALRDFGEEVAFNMEELGSRRVINNVAANDISLDMIEREVGSESKPDGVLTAGNKGLNAPERSYESVKIPNSKDGSWARPEESVGKICVRGVIPYPPGIPLICPGEKVNDTSVNTLKMLMKKEQKIIGLDSEKRILVI